MPPLSVIQRGSLTVPSRPIFVRAGPVSARFEPDGVFLRHIRLDDTEILRGIYVAIRDHNWNTVPGTVSDISIDASDASFKIAVDVHCQQDNIDFTWRGEISGQPDGTIRFAMDGVAHSTFRRNRIGILVLHPPRECAGQPCTVEAPDGTVTTGAFPLDISPHQPFFEIQAITHRVAENLEAEVRFTGDVFEMEDQRNWTDASFKTYSTPLEVPFPVTVERGTTIRQSATLRLKGAVPESISHGSSTPVRLERGDEAPVELPRIGLCASSDGPGLSETEQARLRALNLNHLRIDVRISEPDHLDLLRGHLQDARSIATSTQIALFPDDASSDDLHSVIDTILSEDVGVSEWLVLSGTEKVAPDSLIASTSTLIRGRIPEAVIAGGTNAYFTELNRERPDPGPVDALCYSINPQVHAFDELSLVETLEAQSWTVWSAGLFAGGRDIVVSPITLRPRFNPNATGPEPEPPSGQVPDTVDSRQMSMLGAAWTLGSLKHIRLSGAVSGTWFETVGWRGVIERDGGAPLPEAFPSTPGSAFPLYHVIADFGEFRGGAIERWKPSDPLLVEGVMLRGESRQCLLIANMSEDNQIIELRWPDAASAATIRMLDETTFELAATEPERFRTGDHQPLERNASTMRVELRPFATARIDFWIND